MKKARHSVASSRRTFLQQTTLVTLAFAGLKNSFESSARGAETASAKKLESDFYGIIDLPPELIRFLAGTDQQVRFYELSGNLPARSAAWEDKGLVDDPRAETREHRLPRADGHGLRDRGRAS